MQYLGSFRCIHHAMKTQKTDLFNVPKFSFPFLSTPDLTVYEQLSGCFQKTRGRLPYRCTWSMLLVFSGVPVAHLLLLLCLYYFSYFMFFVVFVCFPCLVFVSGLHSSEIRQNLGSLVTLSVLLKSSLRDKVYYCFLQRSKIFTYT